MARIVDDCREFYSLLKQLPHTEVYESAANFFLLRFDSIDAARLKDYLARRGMYVRSRPDMPEHLRITSLRKDENLRLARALGDYMANGEG